jgi:hypothetical protein
VTLEVLFARAGIDNYKAATWFRGAVLKPPYLFVDTDADSLAFIRRNYLPLFLAHLPGLEVRGALKAVSPERHKAKPTRFPALKPGPWRDGLDRDLLD